MFQTIWVIIGSLIGAGFASGKEIAYFFYQYGKIGVLGILISALLFGYLIWKTFRILDHKQVQNYREFLEEIIGEFHFLSKLSRNKLKSVYSFTYLS